MLELLRLIIYDIQQSKSFCQEIYQLAVILSDDYLESSLYITFYIFLLSFFNVSKNTRKFSETILLILLCFSN